MCILAKWQQNKRSPMQPHHLDETQKEMSFKFYSIIFMDNEYCC